MLPWVFASEDPSKPIQSNPYSQFGTNVPSNGDQHNQDSMDSSGGQGLAIGVVGNEQPTSEFPGSGGDAGSTMVNDGRGTASGEPPAKRFHAEAPAAKRKGGDKATPKLVVYGLPTTTEQEELIALFQNQGFQAQSVKMFQKEEFGVRSVVAFLDAPSLDAAVQWMAASEGRLVLSNGLACQVEYARVYQTDKDWNCVKCSQQMNGQAPLCTQCSTSREESEDLDARGIALVGNSPCDTLLLRDLPKGTKGPKIAESLCRVSELLPIVHIHMAKSRRYAFVQMRTADDAQMLLRCFERAPLMIGQQIVLISFCRFSFKEWDDAQKRGVPLGKLQRSGTPADCTPGSMSAGSATPGQGQFTGGTQGMQMQGIVTSQQTFTSQFSQAPPASCVSTSVAADYTSNSAADIAMQARMRAEQFKKEIAANVAQMVPHAAKLGLSLPPPGPPPPAGAPSSMQQMQPMQMQQTGVTLTYTSAPPAQFGVTYGAPPPGTYQTGYAAPPPAGGVIYAQQTNLSCPPPGFNPALPPPMFSAPPPGMGIPATGFSQPPPFVNTAPAQQTYFVGQQQFTAPPPTEMGAQAMTVPPPTIVSMEQQAPQVSQAQAHQPPKPISIAPLGGVIGVVDTPYGNYPQYVNPDASQFTDDVTTGYKFDPVTMFYYDTRSGYYFNNSTSTWCMWEPMYCTYIPVTEKAKAVKAAQEKMLAEAQKKVEDVVEEKEKSPEKEEEDEDDERSSEKEEKQERREKRREKEEKKEKERHDSASSSPKEEGKKSSKGDKSTEKDKEKEKDKHHKKSKEKAVAKEMLKWEKRREKVAMKLKAAKNELETKSAFEKLKETSTSNPNSRWDVPGAPAQSVSAILGADDSDEEDINPLAPGRVRNFVKERDDRRRVEEERKEKEREERERRELEMAEASKRIPAPPPAPKILSASEQREQMEKALVDRVTKTCLLCRRAFASVDVLEKHVDKSDLHKKNLEAKRIEWGKQYVASLMAATAGGGLSLP